jgi:DNA primase
VAPGRTLRFALLPEGQDPDDLVRAGGPDAFRAVLAQARPLAELLWLRETSGGVFDTPERRAELEKTLRELTGRIRDESVRRHYQQDMRERVQAFFGGVGGARRERGGPMRGGPAGGRQAAGRLAVTESLARSAMVRSGGGPLPLRETAMLVAMVNHPALLDDYFEAFEAMNPAHPELKRLHGALLDAVAHGVAHERAALVEALAAGGHGEVWERAVRHCRGLGLWPVLGEAAEDDAREAFSQTVALHARASELQRQRRSLQIELAEAVDAEAEDVTMLMQAIAQINLDIASLERLEALVDGFGVSSGRG